MKIIQNKIIKTATWVKEIKTKIKPEFPRLYQTKEEIINGYKMLIILRTKESKIAASQLHKMKINYLHGKGIPLKGILGQK